MNFSRYLILTRKEFVQLVRDPLSVATGILLPIVLLVICGFGMSTDVRNIRMAIVVPESSQTASAIAATSHSEVPVLPRRNLEAFAETMKSSIDHIVSETIL